MIGVLMRYALLLSLDLSCFVIAVQKTIEIKESLKTDLTISSMLNDLFCDCQTCLIWISGLFDLANDMI